jgi:ATP-dependent RNA helicase DeaD
MEFYTHRSGRTARAGKKGVSIAMVSNREMGKVRQIEKTLKAPFTKMKIPTGPEVCQKQLLALMHKVHEVNVKEEEIGEFLPAVYAALKDLTKDELIKRFASIEFNRFLDYYRNAPDLNSDKGSTAASERYGTGTRFFINLGKMDGLDVPALLELLDEYSGVGKRYVGKIDLKGAYSFFEIEKEKVEDIMRGFKDVEFDGRQVRVEVTGKDSGREEKEGDKKDFKKPFSKGKGGYQGFKKSGGSGGYSKRKRF